MKTIQLTTGQTALVDDEDFARVSRHNWYINGSGYANTSIGGKTVFLHNFVLGSKDGKEVDHINGNRMDCRKENLRFCTHSQNIANDGAKSNNKLGVKGVDFHQNKYRATIRVNYKKIFLGYYNSLKEAAAAYNEASRKYFGEFGYQNDLEAISC